MLRSGSVFTGNEKRTRFFRETSYSAARDADNITIINEISLEDYLVSVISSEMSGTAPHEFLKVHSIISRSWLLAALDRKNITKVTGKRRPEPMN